MRTLDPEELWEAARHDVRSLERLAHFLGLQLPRRGDGYARRLIAAIRAEEARLDWAEARKERMYPKAEKDAHP